MNKPTIIGTLVLAVATMGVAANANDAPSVDQKTQKLWEQKCASCHGKDGKGNPKTVKMLKVTIEALDLTSDATAKKSDEVLAGVTSKGQKKMPSFATKLKKEEIAGLVGYIRTLKAPAPSK